MFDNHYIFEDYTVEQLMEISFSLLEKSDLEFDDNALGKYTKWVEALVSSKSEGFANAREIRNVIEKISKKHDIRIGEIPQPDRKKVNKNIITKEDLSWLRLNENKVKMKIGF